MEALIVEAIKGNTQALSDLIIAIEEDLYKIYKELRTDGIVWGDPKIDNLGVLKRENLLLMEKIFMWHQIQ